MSSKKSTELYPPPSGLAGDIAALLIPALIFIEVQLIGRLFLSEILLLGMLPLLLSERGQLLRERLPKTLLLLGLAWLLSQIATDVIRATPFEDWSRGWSKISFLLLEFMSIYLLLYGKEKRFVLFAAGIAIGQILEFFINPNEYAESYPWKFGYGPAITLLIVLAAQYAFIKGRRYFPTFIIAAMGILNLYLDFRSLGLICFLTAGLILFARTSRIFENKIQRREVAALALLCCGVGYAVATIYDFAASEGLLDNASQAKYEMQSSGDMGVLLGGRTEILASAQAVIDSPIIGHGSWAKDPMYVQIMQFALLQYGYEVPPDLDSDLIPSHSYLMGAWVEAGVVGAIFWLWGLILTTRTTIAIYGNNLLIAPLVAFTAFNLLWNIPFSPFGAESRLYVAYNLALMIWALSRSTENNENAFNK